MTTLLVVLLGIGLFVWFIGAPLLNWSSQATRHDWPHGFWSFYNEVVCFGLFGRQHES